MKKLFNGFTLGVALVSTSLLGIKTQAQAPPTVQSGGVQTQNAAIRVAIIAAAKILRSPNLRAWALKVCKWIAAFLNAVTLIQELNNFVRVHFSCGAWAGYCDVRQNGDVDAQVWRR